MKYLFRLLPCIVTFLCCSCSKDVTDGDEFALYYYNVEITVGESVAISPSYHGSSPTGFRIYSIMLGGDIFYSSKLDGELLQTDSFYVDPSKGVVSINSSKLKAGNYRISLTCSSAGKRYDFPDMINVKISANK